MDLGIAGRTALVLAGSKGIGLATAQGLAREGARVAFTARGEAGLAAAAATMPGACPIRSDVSDPKSLKVAFDEACTRLGQVDILVINAGGPPAGTSDALDDAAWRAGAELTLMSAVRAARLALPGMRERRWGRIVVISSFSVRQPVAGLVLSNSLRLAVLGWAKSLADEVAADKVTVNTICPGWTATDRLTLLLGPDDGPYSKTASIVSSIPMQRIGRPDEVAACALFLASETASYITGCAIPVDGGIVRLY